MSGNEKIILDRAVFIVLAVVLVVTVSAVYGILGVDASFSAGIGSAETTSSAVPEENVTSIAEPEDAYELAKITFGGTCTPASMLGSDSYGTFNQAFNDSGAEYFFSGLSDTFTDDDMTIVGLNAVFSDNAELQTAEKENREWYRAPSVTASLFAHGGVDVLSLEGARTMDYGLDGYSDTKAALEAQSLAWSDSGKAIYQTLTGGVKAAVYCCTYSADALPGIHSWIAEAAQSNDFVALYISDTADSYAVSEEKRDAYRAFIDAGADIVVGTNGTKLQPAEYWGDGFIAYSLGSLIDGSSIYPEQLTALLGVQIKVNFGEIVDISYEIVPCVTYDDSHSWQPKLMNDGEEKENVLSFMNGESEVPN